MTDHEFGGQIASTTAPAVTHLSAEQRVKIGKDARTLAPRSSQAEFRPSADRPDPVDLLEEQAVTRLPELVPIRYGRMLVSPFTFFRGAALVMAGDLATGPHSGLTAQICGDAHLSNFGVFASPERRLVFDINDFDETLPGPWEWDVKRLAASCEIAGRDRGFSAQDRSEVVAVTVAEYRTRMRQAATMRTLDVWYSHQAVDDLLEPFRTQMRKVTDGKKQVKQLERNLARTRTRDSLH